LRCEKLAISRTPLTRYARSLLAAVVGIYNGASVVNLLVEAMVVIIDVVDVGRASSIFRGKAKNYSSIQKDSK
jgi:hypothetical protein